VPVYRGKAFLTGLVGELGALRDRLARSRAPLGLVEAIFVDDRAIDGSGELLDRLAAGSDWLRVEHLPANRGQHAATAIGFARAEGDWIATLDEDGQHPPAALPGFVAHAAACGADLVFAAPVGGVHRGFYRNATSAIAKRGVALLAGDSRVRDFNSFRLVRRELARAAAERFPPGGYLDVVLTRLAPRIATFPIRLEDPRHGAGTPGGYDFRALVRHARRLLAAARSASAEGLEAERARLAEIVDRSGDERLRGLASGLS